MATNLGDIFIGIKVNIDIFKREANETKRFLEHIHHKFLGVLMMDFDTVWSRKAFIYWQ